MRSFVPNIISPALALVAACVGTGRPPAPERTRIVVRLDGADRVAAYDLAARAFLAEGLNIASGTVGATLTSTSASDDGELFVTYRAAVVAADTAVEVVLSGDADAFPGAAPPGRDARWPVFSTTRGAWGRAWRRLERVADRLRGAGAAGASRGP